MSRIFTIFSDTNQNPTNPSTTYNSGNGYKPHSYSNYEDAFRDVANGNLAQLRSFYNYTNDPMKLHDFRDYSGNNLLHAAVLSENVQIIKFLLEVDMNVNHKNRTGKTPWDLAIKSQNKEIILLFSDHKNPFVTANNDLHAKIRNLEDKNKQCDEQRSILTDQAEGYRSEIVILKKNNKRLRDENDENIIKISDLHTVNVLLRNENNDLVQENKKLKLSNDNMIKAFQK